VLVGNIRLTLKKVLLISPKLTLSATSSCLLKVQVPRPLVHPLAPLLFVGKILLDVMLAVNKLPTLLLLLRIATVLPLGSLRASTRTSMRHASLAMMVTVLTGIGISELGPFTTMLPLAAFHPSLHSFHRGILPTAVLPSVSLLLSANHTFLMANLNITNLLSMALLLFVLLPPVLAILRLAARVENPPLLLLRVAILILFANLVLVLLGIRTECRIPLELTMIKMTKVIKDAADH
jgi:hypothetical protein